MYTVGGQRGSCHQPQTATCQSYGSHISRRRSITAAAALGHFAPRGRRATVHVAAASKAASKGASDKPAAKGFGAAKAPSVSKSGVSQTCACGSKVVYRECCEPHHAGKAAPPDVEAALRARFCAFVKGRVPYLLSTFHPAYHAFKYGTAPGGAADQLRRDLEAATKRFNYSNLRVLEQAPGSHADEAFITFRYSSVNRVNPELNVDGTVRVSTTMERSRFVRDAPAGPWLFADYELLDYPAWMAEAKEAELRAKGQDAEAAAAAAAAAAQAGSGVTAWKRHIL